MSSNEERNVETNVMDKTDDNVILLDEDRDQNINDIRSKMTIAYNTVKACANDVKNPFDPYSLRNREIQFYAGEASHSLRETKKQINKNIILKTTIDINAFTILCVNIREVIVEYYLQKRTVPSLFDVTKHFRNKGIDWKRFKLTTEHIFQYHHLPKLKKYLILENPELVAKRANYLKKIERYRKEKKYIIYVNEKRLDASKDALCLGPSYIDEFVIMASSTREGWIRTVFSYYTLNHATEQWFRNKMLPQVSQSCVFVILCAPNPDTLPTVITPYSTKEILTDWLTRRNIPHNSDAHRGDLYTLYKKYKGHFGDCSSRLDDLIKSNGHEVLHVPQGYPKLNYFFRLWSDIDKKVRGSAKTTQYLNTIIEASKEYSLDDWIDLENDIVSEEKKILEEDRRVEGVIDNLLTMVKEDLVAPIDFPCECSTGFLEVEDKLNNIIVD